MKDREERYDLIQDRAAPDIPNAEERRLIRLAWFIVSKAAEISYPKDTDNRDLLTTNRHDKFAVERCEECFSGVMFDVGRLIWV